MKNLGKPLDFIKYFENSEDKIYGRLHFSNFNKARLLALKYLSEISGSNQEILPLNF
jgi:hypothetical protein